MEEDHLKSRDAREGYAKKYRHNRTKAKHIKRKTPFAFKFNTKPKPMNEDIRDVIPTQTPKKIKKTKDNLKANRISLNLVNVKNKAGESYKTATKHIKSMKIQYKLASPKEKSQGRSSSRNESPISAFKTSRCINKKEYLTQSSPKTISKKPSTKKINKKCTTVRKTMITKNNTKLLQLNEKKVNHKVMKAIDRVYMKMKLNSNKHHLYVDLAKSREHSRSKKSPVLHSKRPQSASKGYMEEIQKKFGTSPKVKKTFDRSLSERKNKPSPNKSFTRFSYKIKNYGPRNTHSTPKKSLAKNLSKNSKGFNLLKTYAKKHSKQVNASINYKRATSLRESKENRVVDIRMDDKVCTKPRFLTFTSSSFTDTPKPSQCPCPAPVACPVPYSSEGLSFEEKYLRPSQTPLSSSTISSPDRDIKGIEQGQHEQETNKQVMIL
ncbi:unnamed protein product [Moneuplotes crassus]|uniref:Uncharacterized protein n=1 Tax=Euplotes crassus TaxID=5936 RepID=A0AAD1UAW8_EUPCR|nr:unnamed protein product [Moneuplotes crassus]